MATFVNSSESKPMLSLNGYLHTQHSKNKKSDIGGVLSEINALQGQLLMPSTKRKYMRTGQRTTPTLQL